MELVGGKAGPPTQVLMLTFSLSTWPCGPGRNGEASWVPSLISGVNGVAPPVVTGEAVEGLGPQSRIFLSSGFSRLTRPYVTCLP